MSIAIVVLTFDRVHLLQKCVENVILRTSPRTTEVVIWNNASTDGTREYLATIDDPRVRVVNSERNVGLNGYGRAFAETTADYLVEIDDDIIDAPPEWDARLLDAFLELPKVGYLAANLRNDPYDKNARLMYNDWAHRYTTAVENGIRLKLGPVGGGCTLTSRELYDRVGGFRQYRTKTFWQEDAEYISEIRKLGYTAAYLEELEVHHAGGPHYAATAPIKAAYWRDYYAQKERRDRVKRILLHLPLVARLNSRHGWFVPPAT